LGEVPGGLRMKFTRLLAVGAFAFVSPFVVVWGLFYLEHLSPWHSQVAELLFLIAGVAVGIVGVWLLPIKRLVRALLTVPYAIVMAVAAWFSSLPLVCAYFGDCL
jgi:hypothetical protein